LRVRKKTLHGTLTCQVGPVVFVNIRGDQVGGLCIGAGEQQRGYAQHVGGQSRSHQLCHRLAGRHQYLATHVAALLGRSKLIFKVNA